MQTVNGDLIKNKKVLLRMDLDVPIKDGKILDDLRLHSALPTLELCLLHAKSVIIMGHIGRPEGKEVPELSVKPIVEWLEDWYCDLQFPEDKLHVLENLRFEPGEDAQDLNFAKELASYGDFFVNEAFAAHHKAASTTILPTLLPHACGLHFAKEVEELKSIRENPKKPLVAIVGGAKIEDKYPAIMTLSNLADAVLVGGLLPHEIKKNNLEIPKNVLLGKLREDGLDISEETIKAFTEVISSAKQIVWAGPMGKYEQALSSGNEDKDGNIGDKEIAKAIIESKAESIIGGGDTIAALRDYLNKFNFVLIGGGAMLKLLCEGTLPTIDALNAFS